MTRYTHSLYKNKFLQTNLHNTITDSRKLKNIQIVIDKIEFISKVALTELNLVKAHRRFLLRSFILNKDFGKKDEESFIMRGRLANKRRLLESLAILDLLGKPESIQLNTKSINLTFTNILLKLKQLDLYKANIKALSDITVSLHLNNQNRKITNEIFSTQRQQTPSTI